MGIKMGKKAKDLVPHKWLKKVTDGYFYTWNKFLARRADMIPTNEAPPKLKEK